MSKHKHHSQHNGGRKGGNPRPRRENGVGTNAALRSVRAPAQSDGRGQFPFEVKAMEMARDAGDTAQSLLRDAQSTAVEAKRSLWNALKQNPIPSAVAGLGVACAGIGMGWLLIGARSAASSVANQASTQKSMAGVRGLAESAQKSMKLAQDSVGDAARSASDTARRLGHDAEQTFQEHPLGVGAVAMAAGFALGLAIPSSVKEGRWLGQRRDQVVGKVRALAHDVSNGVSSLRQQPAHA